jgi:hypothetical protein
MASNNTTEDRHPFSWRMAATPALSPDFELLDSCARAVSAAQTRTFFPLAWLGGQLADGCCLSDRYADNPAPESHWQCRAAAWFETSMICRNSPLISEQLPGRSRSG